MSAGNIEFNRGAIRPFQCLNDGWQFIKDDYWLFLGISTVGVLVGSPASLILMGPCMCGIYYCLIRREQGKRVDVGMVFKGFDYFVQSLIATLFHVIPMIILIVPLYGLFIFGMILTIPNQPNNRPPDPSVILTIFGMMGGLFLAIFFFAMLLGVVFFFVYPLIVDRGLDGVDAVKVSARAGFANIGGVIGLTLLNGLLGVVGVMCCYVGAFFIMPVTFAAVWLAYRRVFPEEVEIAEMVPDAGA